MADENRPSAKTVVQSAHHWMAEAVKALLDEGELGPAAILSAHLNEMNASLPDKYKLALNGPKNPLNLTEAEMSLALNGSQINAIKEVRSRTGIGLKQAKDFVVEFLKVRGSQSYKDTPTDAWAGKVNHKGEVEVGFVPPP